MPAELDDAEIIGLTVAYISEFGVARGQAGVDMAMKMLDTVDVKDETLQSIADAAEFISRTAAFLRRKRDQED